MSDLTIKPVASRRQRREFLRFPWKLYRNDPNWVPPLRGEHKELVGYRYHPFYERNSIQTFLAHRRGEVCGRIAAILNETHNEYQNERRGFFGFFESIDDQAVADGLFDAVRVWLAERDIEPIRGPTNPSINYSLGTLIEGFDSPPTFMMTYNPPYYPKLIEGAGFRKAQDMYAYYGTNDMLPASNKKLIPVADQIIERFNVKLRRLDRSRFAEEMEAFVELYNRALVDLWNHSPITPEEARHIAKGLKWLIVPEFTVAAEIDGKLVGAELGILDYNPRIRAIDGRLFPFGFIRLLRNRRAIKHVRFVSTNVTPEYRLMGIGLVLLRALVEPGIEWGLDQAEFSWVMESNEASRGSLEKGGALPLKTFRIYDWP